jgi:phage-related minor tail protein
MALPAPARQALLGALEATVLELDHAYLGVGDFIKKCIAAFAEAKNDATQLKFFKFDPKFNTRVTTAKAAVGGFNTLWHTISVELVQKFQQVEDGVNQLVQQLRSGGSLHEAGEPALAAAVDKLQDVHTFLDRLGDLVTNIVNLATIIADVKHRIETLDELFLKQSKPKTSGDFHYRKRIG